MENTLEVKMKLTEGPKKKKKKEIKRLSNLRLCFYIASMKDDRMKFSSN